MFPFPYLLSALLGYLLGSIPTGYLVGRSHGIDIREHGSGNIGATNVVRVLGKKPGYFVFVCDALKGFLAVWSMGFLVGQAVDMHYGRLTGYMSTATHTVSEIYQHLAQYRQEITTKTTMAAIIAALACILGHNFPVWLKFRGGKGVATTVGVLLGLMPAAVGVSAVIWFASFYLFRYVSLASLLGAAALPVAVWFLTTRHGNPGLDNPLLWFSLAAAALIFWRHRANLSRLLNGTEAKFARKTKPPSPAV